MTYGQIISGTAAEAGMTALCPEEMEGTATGIPLIQYRETVWEFAGRLASRFGLPVYPEPSMSGGKLCIGLPETGYAGPMSDLGYTARADGKFYRAGGEASGKDRRHYLTYEVTSLDLFRVGDTAECAGESDHTCHGEGGVNRGRRRDDGPEPRGEDYLLPCLGA